MRKRLSLIGDRVSVVHNGISLDGFGAPSDEPGEPPAAPTTPTIGFLARMCEDKGLTTLVDAFLILKRRGSIDGLRLRAAGVVLPIDEPLIAALTNRIRDAGFSNEAEFLPNLERPEKLRFLRSLSVLSVPATYGESFGLYLLEAMACGVPVVQPRHAAFPEILEATGGGILVEPDDPESLADGLERLFGDAQEARRLAERGRRAVHERFGVDRMAREFADVCMMAASGKEAWRTSSS
jgi:glycosyltransferase involved in cell wall biosynthesis